MLRLVHYHGIELAERGCIRRTLTEIEATDFEDYNDWDPISKDGAGSRVKRGVTIECATYSLSFVCYLSPCMKYAVHVIRIKR